MSDEAPSHLRLYSLIGFMVFCWSANYAVGKHVLEQIPPLLVIGLRMVISALAMAIIFRTTQQRVSWTRGDLVHLLVLGLIGVGANQVLFIVGLARTSVSHAAIMIGLTPLVVLTMAAFSGLERLSVGKVAGMLVALTGVAMLQRGSDGGRANSLLGDLLVFGAGVAFAIYTVRGKAEMHRFGGVTVNAFGYICSALAMLPLTVWLGAQFDFSQVTYSGWLGLLYMALFPSVVCYLIYYYALAHIPASRVSAFAYLQPVIATLIAIPTVGEYPSRDLLAGGAMVLAGVFAAERL